MPDQPIAVSISDPISADFQLGCRAVESVFNFLCTPEGQLTVKEWRDSSKAFNDTATKVLTGIAAFFKGQL